MKRKYFVFTIIVLCIMLGMLALSEGYKGKTGPEELLLNLDTEAALLIKYADISKTEYYKLEESKDFIDLLNIENWTPIESVGQIEKPYLVIRIGEGYEIVLSNAGMIYIENLYALEESEKEGSYMASIEIESILEYIEREAELYDGQVIFNH